MLKAAAYLLMLHTLLYIFDYFSDDNVVGSQMKQVILLNSIHIWDNNGNYVENIQFEQYENSGFVTTLPKLEAGQKYTITCVALVNKQLLSTSATTLSSEK